MAQGVRVSERCAGASGRSVGVMAGGKGCKMEGVCDNMVDITGWGEGDQF